jgi:hypothetical protein
MITNSAIIVNVFSLLLPISFKLVENLTNFVKCFPVDCLFSSLDVLSYFLTCLHVIIISIVVINNCLINLLFLLFLNLTNIFLLLIFCGYLSFRFNYLLISFLVFQFNIAFHLTIKIKNLFL